MHVRIDAAGRDDQPGCVEFPRGLHRSAQLDDLAVFDADIDVRTAADCHGRAVANDQVHRSAIGHVDEQGNQSTRAGILKRALQR